MNDYQKVLDKIEKLVDTLPYKRISIELVMPDKTMTLDKEKSNKMGFCK